MTIKDLFNRFSAWWHSRLDARASETLSGALTGVNHIRLELTDAIDAARARAAEHRAHAAAHQAGADQHDAAADEANIMLQNLNTLTQRIL